MKRITNHLTTLILLSLVIFSCDNPGAKMETITGKSGEVIVVIGKEVWNGPEGSEIRQILAQTQSSLPQEEPIFNPVSYTHLRAHETRHDLVCRLLLEKKKKKTKNQYKT